MASTAAPVITVTSKRIAGFSEDVTARSNAAACPGPNFEPTDLLDESGSGWR